VEPAALIAEIKAFEGATGVAPTGNFLTSTPRLTSDERCYFTGKLQLPEFYSGLRMVRESETRCTARAGDSDVFFYPVQAVASGSEAIHARLVETDRRGSWYVSMRFAGIIPPVAAPGGPGHSTMIRKSEASKGQRSSK